MRFFHISDLHIGKQLNGYNLRENQEEIFSQIISYAEKEKPDAVLISGDIYDKSVPSGEAYTVFDSFLSRLADAGENLQILIIAGNHDSPERLRYASAFLEKHHIFMSVMPPSSPEEYLRRITLSDQWGEVDFYLFPFMKPGYVRQVFPEEKPGEKESLSGYDSSFRAVIGRENIDLSRRNVILAHQFFVSGKTAPETCDSEQAVITAGGLDAIDSSALAPFDYAALGHIHGPQRVGRETARYCGSPCKYSVSEEHHRKSLTMVTLREKGREPEIETLPLISSLDVRRIKGSLSEVLGRSAEKNPHDYVSITLTDEEEVYDFREQLEAVYDHILDIRIDNTRTRKRMAEEKEEIEILNPFEAFRLFFEAVRRAPMTEEQEQFMKRIVEEAKEEEER